ncbi:hypothetical protein Tco_0845665 [Tanacetum coccineum]
MLLLFLPQPRLLLPLRMALSRLCLFSWRTYSSRVSRASFRPCFLVRMLGRFRSLVMMAEDWRVITEVGVEACTRWRNKRGLFERPDFIPLDFIPTPGLGSFMANLRGPIRFGRWASMLVNIGFSSAPSVTKDSGPDLVRYSVRLSLCYALWHGTGDFGPNMFFDISASPKYMSGLCRTGLAKVIG